MDTATRTIEEDVAIVAYELHEELTGEGKPVTLDAADASIWVRRNGRWLCVLHTEAILGIRSVATGSGSRRIRIT